MKRKETTNAKGNKMKRHGNTATEMKNDGEWASVGRKHYRHISGAEVKYDCDAWGWRINGEEVYKTLHVAKYYAERRMFVTN